MYKTERQAFGEGLNPQCNLNHYSSRILGVTVLNRSAEFLAGELKKLVGYGAHPKRLPTLPVLASLAAVPPEASFVSAGYLIRRYLIKSIDSLAGSYRFLDRDLPADKLNRAFKLLFQIEGAGQSVVNRRYRAISVLELSCSVDQWRRPYGVEFELCLVLAEHICQTSAQPSH